MLIYCAKFDHALYSINYGIIITIIILSLIPDKVNEYEKLAESPKVDVAIREKLYLPGYPSNQAASITTGRSPRKH